MDSHQSSDSNSINDNKQKQSESTLKQQKHQQSLKQQQSSEQIKQKHLLKQQAKQTLLKQCYKMAMNKYLRLIQMGSEGFSQRQWSVIHLNTAIAMQFQNKINQALQKANQAIKIDRTYEKAYYRRLQLLDQMGEYQAIFHDNIVPANIKNAQIDKLRQDIKQKYKKSAGLERLQQKLKDEIFIQQIGSQYKLNKFVEQMHGNIFNRIKMQMLQKCGVLRGCNAQIRSKILSQIDILGNSINEYYKFLTGTKPNANTDNTTSTSKQYIKSFYQNIYKLCLSNLRQQQPNPKNNQYNASILRLLFKFWQTYSQHNFHNLTNTNIIQIFSNKAMHTNQKSNNKQYLISQHRQNKQISKYQALMYIYCPTILINSKIFIQIISLINQPISQYSNNEIVYESMMKYIHNNKLYLHLYNNHRQMLQQQYKIQQHVHIQQQIQQQIYRYMNNQLIKSIQKYDSIKEYKQKSMLVDSLLEMKEILAGMIGGQDKVQRQKQKQGQQRLSILSQLYILKYQLSSSTSTHTHTNKPQQQSQIQQTHTIIQCLHKLFLQSNTHTHTHTINTDMPQLNKLYLAYQTIQSISIIKLKQSKQYKNSSKYQQLLQYMSEVITNVNVYGRVVNIFNTYNYKQKQIQKQKQNGQQQIRRQMKQYVIRYLLCFCILSYLQPAFVSKIYMQSISTNNNNMNSNNNNKQQLQDNIGLLHALNKLSNIQQIYQLLYNTTNNTNTNTHAHTHMHTHTYNSIQKRSKQILKMYLHFLIVLCIPCPAYLSDILSYPQTITHIYSLLYPKQPIHTHTHSHHPHIHPHAHASHTSSHTSSSLISLSCLSNLQLRSTTTKLLYSLLINISQQQQQQYAQKMGVSKQQIHKAKQLQQQNYNTNINQQINKKRQAFIGCVIAKWGQVWGDIITNIVNAIKDSNIQVGGSNRYSNRQCSIEQSMMVGIIDTLAEADNTKFYSNCYVQFMLNCYNKSYTHITKLQQQSSSPSITNKYHKICYKISHYFCQISKKCNPNIYTYTQLQPIVNTLIYLIKNAKHQLHIFQSLLSLVNLSSRAIIVPFDVIIDCFMEENQYIVHGGMEVLNNVLVNGDQDQREKKEEGKERERYVGKLRRLEDIVSKYYMHYRNVILSEMNNKNKIKPSNINDYSHPYKIYCTILSVLMVFETISNSSSNLQVSQQSKIKYKVIEFGDWKDCHAILKHISDNKGDVSMTLFRMVLYHAEKKTLPNGWQKGLEEAIQKLRMIDADKWNKINKYIR